MKKTMVTALICLFVAAAANAQMKPAPAPKAPGNRPLQAPPAAKKPSFARISQEDALKLYRNGKVTFIDVRSNEQYRLGHIKDSLSIPGSQLIRRFNEVPPGTTVITYCACTAEQSSGRAAADLMAHGVKNVFALKGGWNEWKAGGSPTAVGPK